MSDRGPSPQTRGFLFADLRGYSAFTELHGDVAARELLRRYRGSVREVIGRFGGAEIRTEGDSFYVVFLSVAEAVRAGLAITAAVREGAGQPAGHPIQVGVGIHAGESEDSEEGIVSGAVNVAARVCAAAEPGEVLVTDTVRALTRTYLEVQFIPRGRRRLKGIGEPVTLYRVLAAPAAPPAARRRLPPALGDRRWLVTAGVGAVLAVAVAIGAATIGDGFGTASPTLPPTDADTDGTASAAAVASASASPSASTGEFPTDAERSLLDRLPTGIDPGSCERADPDRTPRVRPFEDLVIPMATIAGVTCQPAGSEAPDSLGFWHAGRSLSGRDVDLVTVAFLYKVSLSELARGSCETESDVYGPWEFGPLSGMLLCRKIEGDAEIVWTYEEADIIASALRRDGDLDSLLRWWREHRLLGS
jgi:class 3 adenylate cyclase